MAFGFDMDHIIKPFIHKMEDFTHGINRVVTLLEVIVEAIETQQQQVEAADEYIDDEESNDE